jgi:hypothetical protein
MQRKTAVYTLAASLILSLVGRAGRGQEGLHVDPQPAGRLQHEQVVAQLQLGRGAARR